jgi:hypothetical protein
MPKIKEEKVQFEPSVINMPRTKEMQETINHLILGLAMWLSITITCVTTILTVHNAWCLVTIIFPFVFTMFPQVQRFMTAMAEVSYIKIKNKKGAPESGTVAGAIVPETKAAETLSTALVKAEQSIIVVDEVN